jgi:hypothetical protein
MSLLIVSLHDLRLKIHDVAPNANPPIFSFDILFYNLLKVNFLKKVTKSYLDFHNVLTS